MNALLLFSFLSACCVGAIAAWRASCDRVQSLLGPLLLLSSAGIAGALLVAAETGSAAARYFGLVAVLLASAGFCGSLIATRRLEKASRNTPRP
ncbi:NAD(P)(+) transhydrogenase (Re/Si-specific) [Sphingobium sp. EP60837]|jgi:NAD(P) transhydrogenase subunit alpha|nr:NAD(P)(+) transhydrogenase (Re/Si-specific) [Sphingobium sp. EP60837]